MHAHVGGEAAQASAMLGAKVYASGDSVAFRSSPDLHTAAHEAAHVVTMTFDNPHVPTTAAEQLARLTSDLPADTPRYSWTFHLTNPTGSPGQSVTAHLDCSGRRSIVRVERALTDASGAHVDPSRTDTAHYGSAGPPPPPSPLPATNPASTGTPNRPATQPSAPPPAGTGTTTPPP